MKACNQCGEEMNLEYLEEQLEKISPWPWKAIFGGAAYEIRSPKLYPSGVTGYVEEVACGFANKVEADFISSAPQNIATLIEALKEYQKEYQLLKDLDFGGDYIWKTIKKLKEAVEVIEFYSNQHNYYGNAGAPPDAPIECSNEDWDRAYKAKQFIEKWGEDEKDNQKTKTTKKS